MNLKTVCAAFIAPAMPCAMYAISLGAVTSNWQIEFGVFAIALVVAEVVTFAIGLPALWVLRRVGDVGRGECVVSGGIIAIALAVVLIFARPDPNLTAATLIGIATWSIVGAATGYLFWQIALRETPREPSGAEL